MEAGSFRNGLRGGRKTGGGVHFGPDFPPGGTRRAGFLPGCTRDATTSGPEVLHELNTVAPFVIRYAYI